ncbi:MAG: diaminopimelate epimerase [Brevinematales bacterium]|nr:diaminopimelate epimerase [Brevinematales bacterium]
MELNFTKMQALGNDYILINGFEYQNLLNKATELAIKLSDRHFGIGGDGIIFALPSRNADLMMRIFNADGSEAEMCGNGIRQLIVFALEKGLVNKDKITVETLAGIKTIEVDKKKNIIKVDMGYPILEPSKIPAIAELNKGNFAIKSIEVEDRTFNFTLVSMGNPHAVTFVENVSDFNVEKYGKVVENMTSIFPKRTNVEFIEVVSRNLIKMRVWERGSGETFACGTGACASVVASILNGYTDNKVTVKLLGGDLYIELIDGKVYMTGDAHKVFDGVVII